MDDLDDVRAYYERDEERDRLASGIGLVEFERTKEIVGRALPPPPAVVADIGGGPGRYSVWLASLGYEVRHRDLMSHHVEHLRRDADDLGLTIDTAVADARHVDLDDRSVDAVLFLGPLYHLRDRPGRLAALAEARRIVRPGGVGFVAAISRWVTRLDGVVRLRVYRQFPEARDLIDDVERTGVLPPLGERSFVAYTHTPDGLRDEVREAGFEVEDLVCVEGIAFALADLDERLADPLDREVLFETARAHERVPELLGLGPHLLATARRTT